MKLDGDKLEFTAAGGRAIRRGLDQIAKIDLSCGKIVYLSDLKPDAETFAPDPFTMPQKNLPADCSSPASAATRTWNRSRLRTHGQEYRKGMAMRSRSELAWTLPGKFSAPGGGGRHRRLTSRPLGNVRLQIIGDGKSLLDATISGSDKDAPCRSAST